MRKRILAIFAHPDDETFIIGGSIAKYAAQGVGIYLVCATSGEVGAGGLPKVKSPNHLAKIRKEELAKATQILGIKYVRCLDFIDGQMEKIDRNFLKKKVAGEFIKPLQLTGMDGKPVLGTPDPKITTRIDIKKFLPLKIRAVKAHKSQKEDVGRLILFFKAHPQKEEWFLRVLPQILKEEVERNLFDGI